MFFLVFVAFWQIILTRFRCCRTSNVAHESIVVGIGCFEPLRSLFPYHYGRNRITNALRTTTSDFVIRTGRLNPTSIATLPQQSTGRPLRSTQWRGNENRFLRSSNILVYFECILETSVYSSIAVMLGMPSSSSSTPDKDASKSHIFW